MTTPRLLMLLGNALPVLAVFTKTDTRTGKVERQHLRTRRSIALCRRGIHWNAKHAPHVKCELVLLRSRTLKSIDVAPDEKPEPSV